jgi:very-short-patch-repair endonuclease/predicted transcriptional regulator of viral defense system
MREEVRHHLELAALAEDQHGVVSHQQLLRLGYSQAAVGRSLGSGRLHRIFRGAYAVGHRRVSRHGICLAAVLACGDGALLSHLSAGWLWGITATFLSEPHVTVPSRGHSRRGIAIHHSTILEPDDRKLCEGLPVTSVSRTLLDLAATESKRSLEGAIDRAERLDLLDMGDADALLARCGSHRGRAAFRRAAELYRDPAFFRARSERLLLALIKRAGLPRPMMNAFVEGHEIDAFWPDLRFAVEVDGWVAHRSRKSFELDPLRQEHLKLAGIEMVRITARRIERESDDVAANLRRLLRQRQEQLHPGRNHD